MKGFTFELVTKILTWYRFFERKDSVTGNPRNPVDPAMSTTSNFDADMLFVARVASE